MSTGRIIMGSQKQTLYDIAQKQPDKHSFYISVPLDSVPLDGDLKFPVYLLVAENYVLFRNVGDTLSRTRASSLRDKRVDTVYVHQADWDTFLKHLEDMIPTEEDLERHPKQATIHLRNLLVAYQREMEAKRQLQGFVLQHLITTGERLAASIIQDPRLGALLLQRYSVSHLYPVNHSVNVAIFSAVLGQKLGFSEKEIKRLTIAALLHNVGNIFLPNHLFYKEGGLTWKERDEMNTHTLRGAEMLRDLKVPEDAILTALQHHERHDGSGYPDGLKGDEIHPFAKITKIADVYDALISVRPYCIHPLTPDDAIRFMKSLKGEFDPAIFAILSDKKKG